MEVRNRPIYLRLSVHSCNYERSFRSHRMRYQKPRINLSNKRFGRLVAIRDIGSGFNRNRMWECKCDCGRITSVPSMRLRNGITKSCGCIRKETAAVNAQSRITHGIDGTPVCQSWRAMIHRCYDYKDVGFKNYGGRGIFVCEYLRASPLNLKSLIGERPEGLSLNRIKNNLHYSCGECSQCLTLGWKLNVEWATRINQNRNTRQCVYIIIDGESKCATEWSEISGIPVGTIRWRFRKGWPISRLFEVGQCRLGVRH